MSVAGKCGLIFKHLLDLVYPESCTFCCTSISGLSENSGPRDTQNPFFCETCWQSLKRLDGPVCPLCSAPFQSDAALSCSPGHLCAECREDPPSFFKAITPYQYEGAIAKAVCSFKYERRTGLAKYLAGLLLDDLSGLEVDCITAIPLHVSKLRLREFNQSLLLAKALSLRTGWAFNMDLLIKTRATAAQVGLSKKKRKQNVKGAFSVSNSRDILGKHILLVDDVYTTGATLKECAKTLMKSGAKSVVVCALARMTFGEETLSQIDQPVAHML